MTIVQFDAAIGWIDTTMSTRILGRQLVSALHFFGDLWLAKTNRWDKRSSMTAVFPSA